MTWRPPSPTAVLRGGSPEIPAGGEYRGREEILGKWLPELGSTYEGFEAVAAEVLDAGDHVIVLGEERGTVAGTPIQGPFRHVWRYEGDQVVEGRFFGDSAATAPALRARRAHAVS